jgi:hypothetical protein
MKKRKNNAQGPEVVQKVKLTLIAEAFAEEDFFDFEAEHERNMQDPVFEMTCKISDKFAAIANEEKLKVIKRDPYDFDAIEKVQRDTERRMNAMVLRIQKSYLKKVRQAESAYRSSHVGLPQFSSLLHSKSA